MIAEGLWEGHLDAAWRLRILTGLGHLRGTRHRTQGRLRVRNATTAGCQVIFDHLPHSIEPGEFLFTTADAVHPLGAKITHRASFPAREGDLPAQRTERRMGRILLL